MKSKKRQILLLLLFISFKFCLAEAANDEDYIDEETTTSSSLISNDKEIEEDIDDQHLYDDNDTEDDEAKHTTPYNCPSECKCLFDKVDPATINFDKKKKRLKRIVVNYLNDSSVNDYEEDEEIESDKTFVTSSSKKNYEISIDCSSQSLDLISNLFDYDFPLDQIVNFNLSNNRFKYLKLSDSFEDLINLRTIDLSSNQLLTSISPKSFLKKFRHLRKVYLINLNQLKCSNDLSQLLQLDCKWFRMLVYLHKRNVTVVLDYANRCDVTSIVNNLSLMTKCYNEESNEIFSNSASQLIEIDANNKFEFQIEPEISQLLFEGDTFELTCRLKRINLAKTSRKASSNFQKSNIKWLLNDRQQLMVSNIYYHQDKNGMPTQVQIFEIKNSFSKYEIIESKLVITNTVSSHNSGKYSCAANVLLADDNINQKLITLNSSHVDIKILNKNDLDTSIVPLNNAVKTSTKPSKLFCPEIITQTYKGIYKWPKTLAGIKITQKCSNKTESNINDLATFECKSDGKWANLIELPKCKFESNLTRYLETLVDNYSLNDNMKTSKLISLEELIHNIVLLQSTTHSTINMYDILFIQKFLIVNVKANKSLLANNESNKSWRHQFIWLNDMLSKLNKMYLRDAQQIESKTFSTYFFDCLFTMLSNFDMNENTLSKFDHEVDDYYDYEDEERNRPSQSNDLTTSSSYLASVSFPSANIKSSTSNVSCQLNKYDLTQQIYFNCTNSIQSDALASKIDFDSSLITNQTKKNSQFIFILFESDMLFPLKSSVLFNKSSDNMYKYESNYDFIELMSPSKLTSISYLEEERSNETCAQIFSLVSSNLNITKSTKLNLTLEIKMPKRYYNLLGLIQNKLNNSSTQVKNNKTRENIKNKISWFHIEKEKNLFDEIFNQNILTSIAYINDYDPQVNISSLNEYNNKYDQMIVNESRHLRELRHMLLSKWFNLNSYELVYGSIVNESNGNGNKIIEWSTSINTNLIHLKLINECVLEKLEHAVVDNKTSKNSSNFNYNFRFYSRISCNLNDKHFIAKQSVQFLSLRHKPKATSANYDAIKSHPVLKMIDTYASVFGLSSGVEFDDSKSFLTFLNTILNEYYQPFHFRIIYFASISSCLLLLASIFIYILLSKRLQMPRAFYHVYLNVWTSVLMLLIFFCLGINQVKLPQLCFSTSIILHYLTICALTWHSLYFYCLLNKLKTLKKRNYNLIFNFDKARENANAKEDDDMPYKSDAGEDYIPKPVLHFYMFGWGVPALLCSIIVSITKRDYIKLPYSFCFTNNPNILIGSILMPLIVMIVFKITLVVVASITIRRILNDLKQDTEEDDLSQEEKLSQDIKAEELNDKAELCQNWTRNMNTNQQENEDDDLKEEEMIEIKMNPVTQKSMIVSINENNKRPINSDDDNDSSTFNASAISNQSARTSIMDMQHKPQVQLKFFCFSFLTFLLTYVLAMFLVSCHVLIPRLMNDPSLHQIFVKIFSYLFSILVFFYAIIQLSFYVLSRDDCVLFANFCNNYKNNKKLDEFIDRIASLGRRRKSINSNEKINEEDEKNWYSESKEEAVDTIYNKIQEEKDQMDICDEKVYDHIHVNQSNYHKRSMINGTIYECRKSTLIMSNAKTDRVDKSPKSLDELSDENENDNLHNKESICDVIFSARKSPNKPSPSTVSLKSSYSPSSEFNPSEPPAFNEISCGQYKSEDINTFINDNSNICATLAIQEDTRDLLFSPESKNLIDDQEKEEKSDESIGEQQVLLTNGVKKSLHVRNPSHGNATQTIQLLNDISQSNNDENNLGDVTSKSISTISRSKINNTTVAGKKPLYVFVDYTYEEKVLHKKTAIISSTSKLNSNNTTNNNTVEQSQEESHTESIAKVNHRPSKLDDLFNNSCSANTGTAISSVPTLKSDIITLNSTDTMKSSLTSNFKTSPSISTNNKSGDSATSSLASSSNGSSSNLQNNHQLIPDASSTYQRLTNQYEDRYKYLNLLSNTNQANNSHNQISNYNGYVKVNQHLHPSLPHPPPSTRHYERRVSNSRLNNIGDPNYVMRTNLMIRPNDIKSHETSV